MGVGLFSYCNPEVTSDANRTQNHSKKSLAVSTTVTFFLQDVRMAIFENQSMTTNTKSFPFLVDEKPDM
jgi:hypothetical protein